MSEAYQVLSDEKLREKYDKYGLQDGILPDGGFMNAEKFFQQMFGGEKFQPIIGDLALGKLLSEMAVAEQASANTTDQTNPATAGSTQANDASVTPGKAAADDMFSKEKMAAHHAAHAARVNQLVANLIEKTRFLVVDKSEDAVQFKARMEKEAADLKEESYGPELLATIGYTYESKADYYLTKDEWYGMKGIFGTIKDKGHIIGRVVDTVGAMREAGPKKRNAKHPPGPEEDALARAQREEAQMMLTLWKASSLEVELTLREVCVAFLNYNTVPGYKTPLTVALKKQLKPTLTARASALRIIGQVYQTASKQS